MTGRLAGKVALTKPGGVLDGDYDTYRQIITINQDGVYLGMRAVAAQMVTQEQLLDR